MTEVRLNDFVGDHLDDMVVVTGLPRSGTTILGKLIGSLQSVEYAFEPPVVAYLDAQRRHGHMSESAVAELLDVYLYYEYFAEQLHGRRLNFREKDATYVLDMQSVPEVMHKWGAVDEMQDALEIAPEYTFSFKFPGTYDAISSIIEHNPDARVVDIGRNLDRVVASLLAKGWFDDENLGPDATGLWPFLESDGELLVPYLVDEADRDRWQRMTPETRTVYICNRFAESRLAFHETYGDRETVHRVRYERLVEEPAAFAEELTSTLGLSQGAKTSAVIDEIEPTAASRDIDALLKACASDVLEQFKQLRTEFER